MLIALAVWNALKPYTPSPTYGYTPNSQSDVYDATNNPAGNLLGTAGIPIGSGGTVHSTCSGTTPTNWDLYEGGTGTITCVGSIESTRADGIAGERGVVTFSDATAGSSDYVYFRVGGSLGTSNLTLGTDQVYMEADIDISNVANMSWIGASLQEHASVYAYSQCLWGGPSSSYSSMVSSSQIASLQEAKILPDYGLTASGSFRFHCRTPPITTQSGATSYGAIIQMQPVSGTSSASATVKVSNVAVRKYNVQ
jgi:hypothetical protein